MRTTIDINDARLRELRQRARSTGRSFKDVVDESLKLGLSVIGKPTRKKKIRIDTHPLGINPGLSGVSLNQLFDQLEAEDSAGK